MLKTIQQAFQEIDSREVARALLFIDSQTATSAKN
uniref:Ribonuclease h1-like protein n=1 Tax=Triatoma infestans TaxID=30076 RepID=A0A161N009_TRIIF